MKQNIDKLISGSSAYKTKLDTAVNNLTTYLNTLNNYINPSYSSGGSYLAPKLNNLNSQMSSLITNIKNRIQNNLGGSVSANNLQAIYTALGKISAGGDFLIDTSLSSYSDTQLTTKEDFREYSSFAFVSMAMPSFEGLSKCAIIAAQGRKSSMWGMGRTAVNDSNFPQFEGTLKISSVTSNRITISTIFPPEETNNGTFVFSGNVKYIVAAWN